jgi:A/G-specific adenine glycosylase
MGEPEQKTIRDFCRKQLKVTLKDYTTLPTFRHTFSHYHLDIFPIVIELKKVPAKVMEDEEQIWYNPKEPKSVGLPKPIQSIMRALL